jgi:hypothetical protein
LDDATGNSSFPNNTVYISYTDCNGVSFDKSYTVAQTYLDDICVSGGTSVTPYYYKDNSQVFDTLSSVVNTTTDCCPTPTPTPTTTFAGSTPCDDYINNQGTPLNGINYTDCNGNSFTNATVSVGQSICVVQGTLGGGDSGFLTLLSNCGYYPPLTPTPTPPTTPVCFQYMNMGSSPAFYNFTDCFGTLNTNVEIIVESGICALDNTLVYVSGGFLTPIGPCEIPPTPTLTPTPTITPTTTLCSCYLWDVVITSNDIDSSTGNTLNPERNNKVYVSYRRCDDTGFDTIEYTAPDIYQNAFCMNNGVGYAPTIDVWRNNVQVSYTSTATNTLVCCSISLTETPTPTPTQTPTLTPTSTSTQTPTLTQTSSPTLTTTSTPTSTAGLTPTPTPTQTLTQTLTQTTTSTPTQTQTQTLTQTPTSTSTPTSTPTFQPTQTPTQSPTLTPTKTPPPTQIYEFKNNCDVFTLFPLGVECVTVSNVSSLTSSDGVLSLNITGGTTPYSIVWSNGQKTRTISGLGIGNYEAQVIDFYGDYTATTICSLSGPTPTPTQSPTPTPTPTTTPVYPNLCLSISSCPPILPIQLILNGSSSGRPRWTSGGYSLVWNVTLQQWEIQNYTIFGGRLVSRTTATPPLSGWFVQGGTSSPTVAMTTGTCPSFAPLNTTIQKTDSDCSNNGSIVISVCGGQTPYQYSNDGGTTFRTSNIFNNLAPQTYNVVVRDALNNRSSATVNVLGSSAPATTYTVSVSNYDTTTINNGYVVSKWSVNVVPPIPQGTIISFRLNINSKQVINGPGTGTISSLTDVYSGVTLINATSSTNNTSTTTRPNCSPETSITTNINDVYNVTMSYGLGISGVTYSTLNITNMEVSTNGCATNLTQDISVFASSGLISGCNCCLVNTNSLSNGGVQNHSINS